ncbi:MAG TPA: UvrD-helicase domain-containing protein [Acidimicrobiales bacterium]|nr:UvrD-helicase domain-containing protein [Acidimicrobiales bacterium]
MTDSVPQDEAVRLTVRTELDGTLFIEAGAGSGKTSELVRRVCALVESGVDITTIAAITFTEKAAAELRVRVREELLKRPTDPMAVRALQHLGDAPMSTLHAFARRLLTEHALRVAVPPGFDVLDEVGEAIYLEARWRELAQVLFDPDAALSMAVDRAVEMGLTPRHLREITFALHDSYDRLLATRDQRVWPASTVRVRRVDLTPLITALDEMVLDDEPVIAEYLARARVANTDGERIDVLLAEDIFPTRGKRRAAAASATGAVSELIAGLRREALGVILPALAAKVVEWADARREAGQLLFHDLLVLARAALRDPDVRADCRDRYQRILIDEFQDTDPLQIEIAVLLASSRPDIAARAWYDDPLTPEDAGRLFFVGDPKQSIYRFRRADIDLYQHAQRVFATQAHHLTENFRTVESIVAVVNDLFSQWMADPDEQSDMQPEYVALTASVPDHDAGSAFATIGGALSLSAAEVRAFEAGEVVRVVAEAKDDEWLVRRGSELVPTCYSDIAILMPTRSSLSTLEEALEEAGIPSRVESRSLIWSTSEVRDLLAYVTALSDPNDEVAIVASLRSPGLACSDRDLAEWRWAGGWWSYVSRPPEHISADHPVARGMQLLHELHRDRWWLGIGELVSRVIDVCNMREVAFAHLRPRDRWRRIDFFLAQARAFEAAGGSSLEEFVTWAREQAEREVWVNEAVVSDGDDDAVRILTVHASKGLEFPIVVLMGLGVQPQAGGPPVLWGPSGPEAKAGPEGDRFETARYEELWQTEKDAFKAERVRLAYVGMTRARDHLVVSLYRTARGKQSLAFKISGYLPAALAFEPRAVAPRDIPVGDAPEIGLEDRARWVEARAAALERLGRSRAIAATGLQHLARTAPVSPIDADDPDDDSVEVPDGGGRDEADDSGEDDRPWRRGRAGTAIGRAVHAVLQTVDLATGEGVDDLAAAQAAAEGVPGLAGDIARRVRGVLQSANVRAAVESNRYWREIFVAVPIGERVLEGFIDLLYETAEGELVVVDYKTDGVRTEHDADEAVGRYRLQAAAYAVAVQRSLQRSVERCAFVFAGSSRCLERDLADLPAACAEVEALVSA